MFGQADSADQKQSLWTSLVSQYARPDINIQINASRFSGLLDTGSDITITSRHLWPKTWPIQKISCETVREFWNFSNQSTRNLSKYSNLPI